MSLFRKGKKTIMNLPVRETLKLSQMRERKLGFNKAALFLAYPVGNCEHNEALCYMPAILPKLHEIFISITNFGEVTFDS